MGLTDGIERLVLVIFFDFINIVYRTTGNIF